ncbi:MAG TPA: mechanosensitive ion channel protein MscS, partial [Roseovarius nubinhibens]|nr:mechanosensitive ion channel protein MscS [Roseovarius nubinhibens]
MDALQDLFNQEIYNGQTLADLVTLKALTGLLGSLVAAIVIILLGIVLSGWAKRRITGLSERHASLDQTLFHFLGNIARYTILAFTAL